MGLSENSKLFTEFPPVSKDKWEEQILSDLKGADYNKKLVWLCQEGIKIQPYYRNEDLEKISYLDSLPGEYPYTRGYNALSGNWEIRQDILLDDISVANQKSLFILDRGITSLGFNISPQRGNMILKSQADFTALMNAISFECIGLYFVCGHNAPLIIEMLQNEALLKKIDPKRILGAVDFDPLGYLTISGNYGLGEEEDFAILKDLILSADNDLPDYRVLGINGYFLHNAGASVVQELAYSLSMASDYLSKMGDKGVSADLVNKHMQFNLGIGSNYFMEIAKIRAMRFLWAKVAHAFGIVPGSCKTFIHSVTSEWNQTIYDPYVNVLRATTESMAAVIGGTDSLTVRPFDYAYKHVSKFSGRLARNIQIILKEESYLDRVADPGAGSYYIENLTNSIVEESWKLFLKTEEEGGYLNALKKGIIQSVIEKTSKSRNDLLSLGREVLLGTNQYPNPDEKMGDSVTMNIAFPEEPVANTAVKPIIKYRGSMIFEKIRLATEKHSGKQPVVFMLTIGNPAMRRARAAFSCNFFACGGFKTIDNPGFNSVDEGVRAALDAQADILVICSSDEEYGEIVPLVTDSVKNKSIVVVAGAPPCMDELKNKGIQYFISVKSNIADTLKQFQKMLGIEI